MADGQKRNILLADDSVTIQKVVELTFSEGNYEVRCVSNGAAALAALNDSRPDIVLCDVIMPEKNGYEVCEEIKSGHNTRGIPVILLTGTFEPFDQDRADKAGADAIVTKPFDSSVLIEKVEELLSNRVALSAPTDGPTQIVSSGQEFNAAESPEAVAPQAVAPEPPPVMAAPPEPAAEEAPAPAPEPEPIGALPDSPGAMAAAESVSDLSTGSPFSQQEEIPADEEPQPIPMDEPASGNDPGATMMMPPTPMVPEASEEEPAMAEGVEEVTESNEPQPMEAGVEEVTPSDEPQPMTAGVEEVTESDEPQPMTADVEEVTEAEEPQPMTAGVEEVTEAEEQQPMTAGVEEVVEAEEPQPMTAGVEEVAEAEEPQPFNSGFGSTQEESSEDEMPLDPGEKDLPQGIAMDEESAPDFPAEQDHMDADPAEEMSLEAAPDDEREPTTESMMAPAHELMDMASSASPSDDSGSESQGLALADEDENPEIVSGSLADMTPEPSSFEEPEDSEMSSAEEMEATDEVAESDSGETDMGEPETEVAEVVEAEVAEAEAAPMPSGPMSLDEETMQRLAELVVQKMSAEVLKEVAWEVIPEMAEVLIKNRIRELEEENR